MPTKIFWIVAAAILIMGSTSLLSMQTKTSSAPEPASAPTAYRVLVADAVAPFTATVTNENALKVDGSATTQPVSGTLTVTEKTPGKSGSLYGRSPDLGYPKTLTVCYRGSIERGLGPQLSVDGSRWYPAPVTLPLDESGKVNGCVALPPARFVMINGGEGSYQVSY